MKQPAYIKSIRLKFCILIPFFIFSFLHVSAQSKLERKLAKLYSKGKTKKMQTLSAKQLAKGDTSFAPFWYLAKVEPKPIAALEYFTKAHNVASASEKSRLEKDARFRPKVKIFARKAKKGSNEEKHIAHFQAEILHDTTEVFRKLFLVIADIDTNTATVPSIKPTILEKDKTILLKVPDKVPERNKMTRFASTLIGTKYKYAGETPDKGFDCSGFVLYVYRNFGYDFLHSSKKMGQLGTHKPLEDAKPGDIVLFGTKEPEKANSVYHVGMVYSNKDGNVEVIHCISQGVHTDSLTEGYWSETDFFIKNIIDAE